MFFCVCATAIKWMCEVFNQWFVCFMYCFCYCRTAILLFNRAQNVYIQWTFILNLWSISNCINYYSASTWEVRAVLKKPPIVALFMCAHLANMTKIKKFFNFKLILNWILNASVLQIREMKSVFLFCFFSFLISSTLAFGSGFSDEDCSGNLFENGNYFCNLSVMLVILLKCI